MLLTLMLLSVGDYPNTWPQVRALDLGTERGQLFVWADPLADVPDLGQSGPGLPPVKSVGMVTIVDQDLRRVASIHGESAGEQLGRGLVLPRTTNALWDFASFSQVGGMTQLHLFELTEENALTSWIPFPTPLPADARFLPWAFQAKDSKTSYNFFASAGEAMYVLSLDALTKHLEVKAVPMDPPGPIADLTVTRRDGELIVRAWPALAEQIDGVCVVAPVALEAESGEVVLGAGKLSLESPSWPHNGGPGTNRAQLMAVEQTSEETSVLVRLGVSRDGSCEDPTEVDNRVELHSVLESEMTLDGGASASRCIAIYGEECWVRGFHRIDNVIEPWTPLEMNWGRQVFDLRRWKTKDSMSYLVVDWGGRRLEGRRVDLLRSKHASFMARLEGVSESFESLALEGKRTVWLGAGQALDLRGQPSVLFASRTRLVTWPTLDWSGHRFIACAKGEGTTPSLTVFDLTEWKFTEVGIEP